MKGKIANFKVSTPSTICQVKNGAERRERKKGKNLSLYPFKLLRKKKSEDVEKGEKDT